MKILIGKKDKNIQTVWELLRNKQGCSAQHNLNTQGHLCTLLLRWQNINYKRLSCLLICESQTSYCSSTDWDVVLQIKMASAKKETVWTVAEWGAQQQRKQRRITQEEEYHKEVCAFIMIRHLLSLTWEWKQIKTVWESQADDYQAVIMQLLLMMKVVLHLHTALYSNCM